MQSKQKNRIRMAVDACMSVLLVCLMRSTEKLQG
jgi:hypothetical protein